jgi:RNA-directed DNA polymerase
MTPDRYHPEALHHVWQRMRRVGRTGVQRRLATGVDGMRAEAFEANLDRNLAEVARRVARPDASGDPSYAFAPLLRIVQAKGGGTGERALHVPRVRDQLVLRVMHEALLDAARAQLDADLRPPPPAAVVKRFRGALQGLSNPIVLRTDIRAFFDSSPREHLVEQAIALGLDPVSSGLFRTWSRTVRARPAWRAGTHHDTPVTGLPQGLSVSASLSELLGHAIDREATRRFRWFRYVDDILVLCETEREAADAHAWIATAVGRHGLELSPAKTAVRRLEDGVAWLGMNHGPTATHADPARVQRWVARFALMRRRVGAELRAVSETADAHRLVAEFERAVRAEVEGRTSTRAAWYALVEDDGAFRELDQSIHALVRSVRRSAGLPPPDARTLPSVHRNVGARRRSFPTPSSAEQGPCATLPSQGGPSADQGQKAPDGVGNPPLTPEAPRR